MTRVSFKTVGCRLNQAETAIMAAGFEAAGYGLVPFGKKSDICVVHTCTVTAKAEKSCIRAARSIKRSNPETFVVMAGCVPETSDKQALLEESGADLVAGQADKFNLPQIINGHKTIRIRNEQPLPFFSTTRALIKVQDGCDFGCAYCIVPAARGSSRSRPQGEIAEEAARLAEAGYREVVLTGANLGSYRCDGKGLVDVIEKIEAIDLIKRIRISSIEMTTIERSIVDYMTTSTKLCRYIHLPLQSGDDAILTAMGRRYTSDQYRRLVEYMLDRIELPGLGTDIIVGFPGENDRAFENTVSMIEDLPFTNLHVFPYSRRRGTRSAGMRQVGGKEKKLRSTRLIEIGEEKKRIFARKFIGRDAAMLVERVDGDGCGTGWTGEYVEAIVKGNKVEINEVVEFRPVRVEESGRLEGEKWQVASGEWPGGNGPRTTGN